MRFDWVLRCLVVAGLGYGAPAASADLGVADGSDLVVGTSLEAIVDPKTAIEGLHRVYVGTELWPGLSVGQAFYSAAMGDAGGAFF
ncbi:MAG: hypothetical protein K0B00_12690 [Rhodobacteraceae bacterium]|nr:hypothetical protein [Paracoccaceae bacterium]